MRQNLLLLQDVIDLGRCGDIVSVKSGFARNYLVPQKKAVVASKQAIRMQKRLKEERAKQAVSDKKDAEVLAKIIESISLQINVKVDPEGKMYGSVSQQDIIHLLEEKEIKIEKKEFLLKHPIKDVGSFTLAFRLKEGVLANCKLDILPEGAIALEKEVEITEEITEEVTEEISSEEE